MPEGQGNVANSKLIKGAGCGTRGWREDFVLTDTDGATALFKVAQADGSVSLGGDTDSKAALSVVSTTKGFRPPKLTTAQRDAIATPGAGLVVYNSTTNKLNVYTGAAWEAVTSV